MNIIEDFSHTWDLLIAYDIDITYGNSYPLADVSLSYEEARKSIDDLRKFIAIDDTFNFGKEKADEFKGILDYAQSICSDYFQAAELLYLIIKRHPFLDGNKRIGCLIFLKHLELSGYDTSKIDSSMLAALAVCIAQSNASEKQSMINFILNLIPKDSK